MEALLIYDYTPFNGFFVSCLAFFITDRYGSFNIGKLNVIPFIRPLAAVFSAIFLIGSKQSTIPIIFAFSIIFIFSRKSKKEIIYFVFLGFIFSAVYILSIGQSIGFDVFFNIYTMLNTRAELKILTRAPKIFVESAKKFNISLAYSFFKESIILSGALVASLLVLGKGLNLNKSYKFYYLHLCYISFFVFIIATVLPGTAILNIKTFRESCWTNNYLFV